MKELPLYLQPGGYIKRAQKRVDRLGRRAAKNMLNSQTFDDEDNLTFDENSKAWQRAQKLNKKASNLKSDIDSGALGSKRGEKLERLSDGFKTGANIAAGALNTASNLAASQMNIAEDSSFHGTQQVGQALSAFGPYGALAGAALTGVAALTEGLGIGTSQINKNQAAAAGLSGGQRILNNIAGILAPGVGSKWTSNAAMQKTAEAQSLSGAYGDALNDIDVAGTMGGKHYLSGRDKINDLIDEANRKNAILTEVGRINTLRKQSDYGMDLAQQNQRIYAGQNYAQSAVGKHGMKLMNVNEIRRILELRKQDEIQTFHNGGVIGIDVNVIPEGKYHAHKNHLGELNEEFEDLTKKGIPVVVHSEGGELEQVAEIEKMELIFRLEVTTQLEELFKDGSEEAMIEAGKLVAFEIMENTQDNSGEVLNEQSTNKNK